MTVRYYYSCRLTLINLYLIVVMICDFKRTEAFDALQCSNNPGKIFQINHDLFDCHDNNVKHIELTMYKRNMKQYVTKARALKVELINCKTTHFFFGAKKEDIFVTVPDISKQQYESAILAQSCETRKPLNGYDLSTKPVCIYNWPTTSLKIVIKCTFTEGIVTTMHDGNMHSNLGNTLSCKYSTGYCLTHDKTAISFIPDPTEENEFALLGLFSGTIIGHHLMIPRLGISIKLHNITLGIQILKDFKINITKIEQPPNLVMPHMNLSMKNDLDTFKTEVNAKLTYILDSMAKPLAEAKLLCEATQINNKLIRSIAQINPTTLARTILKKHEILASAGGQNFIIVHPCHVIHNVTWHNASTSICNTLVPVSYVGTLNQTVHSFFDPLTHVLFSDSPKVNCGQGPDQYFNLGNQTFVYKPGQIPVPIYHEKMLDWPTLKANVTDSLIEVPDNWIFNESTVLEPNDLIWDFLDKKLDELIHSNYDEYDRLAGLSILGFLGISPGHILDGIITMIFRAFAFLGMIAFFKR